MDDVVQEQACWLLLAFESKLPRCTIHEIAAKWCGERCRTLQEFFAVDARQWSDICQLDEKAVAKLELANGKYEEQLAFAQQMQQEGVSMLTVLDERYPKVLKFTLPLEQRPPVLFFMGDLEILDLTTIAIIGSRHAHEESVAFTRMAAYYLAEQGINVISGNARGVDRAALAGAIEAFGCTTLVLPHGMRWLGKEQAQELRPKIEAGNVLALSQFHPKAIWTVPRAMERNNVVTGLARIVIVAESNTRGGTWEGANGALRQYRLVYVRQSDTPALLSGNRALLEHGAYPLYWPINEGRDIEQALLPVLKMGQQWYHEQDETLVLQLAHLLKEHWVSL